MSKLKPTNRRPRNPRAAFAHAHNKALESENLRKWLMQIERDLDGIFEFGDKPDALFDITRLMRTEWRKWDDGVMPAEYQDRFKFQLRRICVNADWHTWDHADQPRWIDETWRGPFSRLEIADIAIAREATGKPHHYMDVLKHWIEDGELDIAKHLYINGNNAWREFALLHLDRGVSAFFSRGGLMAQPGNWPGRTLKFARAIADTISPDTHIAAKAQNIIETIETQRDRYVDIAKRNALSPFMA